jgi:hypothetical protein
MPAEEMSNRIRRFGPLPLTLSLALAGMYSFAQELPEPAADPDTAADASSEPAPALVTRFELQIEFDELIAQDDWESAAAAAETLLELTA